MKIQEIETIDMHTAGEPVRIIVAGYPELPGATLLDRRRAARDRFDHLRRALMHEPRGHAGMYGVILLPPSNPRAVASVLFTHHEGYSTMCGHATIALGRYLVDHGHVPMSAPRTRFAIEAPCGLIELAVETPHGHGGAVRFTSVPAFVERRDLALDVAGLGRVRCDIAYGGAYYAILPSSRLGLPFFDTPVETLTDAAARLTDAIRAGVPIVHPDEPDLGFLYGTILTDDAAGDAASANLCIFADRQIDRSPTGSGVTARMALDFAAGRVAAGAERRFVGISGEAFTGRIVGEEASGAVRVEVGGEGFYTGAARFRLEAGDPLRHGFALPTRFPAVGKSR